MAEKSLIPTRKWFAAQVVAVLAFISTWVTAGDWNKTLTVALLGLIAQAIASYLYPNADTPGGVPLKS